MNEGPGKKEGGETGVRGVAPQKIIKMCVFKPFWKLWICGIDRTRRDLSACQFSDILHHWIQIYVHSKSNGIFLFVLALSRVPRLCPLPFEACADPWWPKIMAPS